MESSRWYEKILQNSINRPIKIRLAVFFMIIYIFLFVSAELRTYGFNMNAFRLVQSHLSKRKRQTKKILSQRSWNENSFVFRKTQPLGLCCIFLYDLLIMMSEKNFASYTDDNITYVIGKYVNDVIQPLKDD